MPTILRIDAFRFFFYTSEPGEPAHIHIAHSGRTAKYWLEPVELARSEGFRGHELGEVRALVLKYRDEFIRSWNEHHRSTPRRS